MKQTLLSLALLVISTASMAQMKPISATTTTTDGSETTYSLYNELGLVTLEINPGVAQTVYAYNDLNQLQRQETTNAEGDVEAIEYTYNDLGQVSKEEEFMGTRSVGYTTYTYDEHGNRTSMTPSRSGMPINISNTYDTDGYLIKVEVMHPMNPSMAMSTTEYFYENGLKVKEVNSSQNVVSQIINYTYDDNNLLIQAQATDATETVISTTTYANGDIDVSFQPQAVTATPNEGNTITVSWTGTATDVFVAGQRYAVSGNTFTTPVLKDGTYDVYVVNQGNAAVVTEVTVFDATKVGVSNVALNGDIVATRTIEKDKDGEDVEVITYNIPLKWELPATSNPIGYRIFYNDTYYVDVNDGSLRTFTLPARNFKVWNSSTFSEVLLDTEIRIIAIYETGECEPANTIKLNTEEILALHVVATSADDNAQKEVFSISGMRMNADQALPQGTYIMRKGSTVSKVQVKK